MPKGTLVSLTSARGTSAVLQADGSWRCDEGDGGWATYDADGRVLRFTPAEKLSGVAPDGTATWVQGDGSLRAVSAAGLLVSLTSSSGNAAILQPDGTWQITDSYGETRLFDVQGRLMEVWPGEQINEPSSVPPALSQSAAGQWSAGEAGGTLTTWNQDGSIVVQVAGGNVTTTSADDVVRCVAFDETVTVTDPDGTVTVQRADHSGSVTAADGHQEVIYSDGTRLLEQTDGSNQWEIPEGTLLTEETTGEVVAVFTDGARIRRDDKGRIWEELAGSTGETRYQGPDLDHPSGQRHPVDLAFPTGVVRVDWADGRFREVGLGSTAAFRSADGTVTRWLVTGQQWIAREDGTWTRIYEDGSRVDGQQGEVQVVTLPDGSTITRPPAEVHR